MQYPVRTGLQKNKKKGKHAMEESIIMKKAAEGNRPMENTMTVKKAAILRKGLPTEIEQDLEKMAEQGWMLTTLNAKLEATFEKREPAKVRFVADYVGDSTGVEAENKDLAADGYQKLCNAGGWFLWAKEYTGERPLAATNLKCLIEKLGKEAHSARIMWAAQLPLWVIWIGYWLVTHGLDTFMQILIPVMVAFCVTFAIVGAVAAKKIDKVVAEVVEMKAKGGLR